MVEPKINPTLQNQGGRKLCCTRKENKSAKNIPKNAAEVTRPLTNQPLLGFFSIAKIAAVLYSPPAERPCTTRVNIITTPAKEPKVSNPGKNPTVNVESVIKATDSCRDNNLL